MAWIRTIGDDEAEGRLGGIYRAAIKRVGRVAACSNYINRIAAVLGVDLEPEMLD